MKTFSAINFFNFLQNLGEGELEYISNPHLTMWHGCTPLPVGHVNREEFTLLLM